MMADARRPILAGNWKMHHDHLVAIQVVQNRDLVPSNDIEAVLHNLETQRLVQARGESFPG